MNDRDNANREVTDSWRTRLARWDREVARDAKSQQCSTDGCPYLAQRHVLVSQRVGLCPVCLDERAGERS